MANLNENSVAGLTGVGQLMAAAAIEIVKNHIITNGASIEEIPELMRRSFSAFAQGMNHVSPVTDDAEKDDVRDEVKAEAAAPVVAPKHATSVSPAGDPPRMRKNGYNAPVMQVSDEEFLNRYPAKCTEKESLANPGKLVCLIDGNAVSFLRLHLAKFGISHEDYIRIYGLSKDYPYTPKKFKKTRSAMAKQQGLGTTLPKTPRAEREKQAVLATPKTRVRHSKRIAAKAA